MPSGITVAGAGVGAATAAHCLAQRGIVVAHDAPLPASGYGAPVVMLGAQAQTLLRDIFADHAPLALALERGHRIARRIVRWGSDDAHAVPHSALVIAGDVLGTALTLSDSSSLPFRGGAGRAGSALSSAPGHGPHPDPSPEGGGLNRFRISTLAPPTSTVMKFGQRQASAKRVVLQPGADQDAALIEAIAVGWLFLIPTGAGAGWLLTVGADPADALRESRLVAPAIAETDPVSKRFETAPRILDDPTTPAALTLGTGAVAFDPICGDGVAMAVRGGILAAAVAAEMAADSGLDRTALIGHYRAMLIAAMRRHLAVSSPFYERGGQGPWWREQAEAIAEGHAWCTRQLAAAGDAQFVLAGDRLVLRDRVA